jgi:hypothetical protein
MNDLTFEEGDQKWDFDRFAMGFGGYDGTTRVICLISGEALISHFGARGRREDMEAAFVANRREIEEKARELYRAGAVTEEGRVLVRSADFAVPTGAYSG